MRDSPALRVAIVDYGMGNLFSVRQACEAVGLSATITASKREVLEADLVILPGVGAFGNAMQTLMRLALVEPLRDLAQAGRPLVGVCLGLQLLMTDSEEFGHHRGLDLIEGSVVRLPVDPSRPVKIPQVGWNSIHQPAARVGVTTSWDDSPLQGFADADYMYFVHSFCVVPADAGVTLTTTTYGGFPFCSSLMRGSVFGCQFHPERSGPGGLRLYRNLAEWVGSLAACAEDRNG